MKHKEVLLMQLVSFKLKKKKDLRTCIAELRTHYSFTRLPHTGSTRRMHPLTIKNKISQEKHITYNTWKKVLFHIWKKKTVLQFTMPSATG